MNSSVPNDEFCANRYSNTSLYPEPSKLHERSDDVPVLEVLSIQYMRFVYGCTAIPMGSIILEVPMEPRSEFALGVVASTSM